MKPGLLILTKLTAARNPMIRMYVHACHQEYDVSIMCSDPEAAAVEFADIPCDAIVSPLPPSIRAVAGFWRRFVQPAPQASVSTQEQGDLEQGRKSRHRNAWQLDWRYLAHHMLITLRTFVRTIRCRRPALIVAIDGEVLTVAHILAILWRVPYVYAVYEIWPNQFAWYSPVRRRTMAIIEKWGLVGAAASLVVDESWAKMLARRYHIPRCRFTEIRTCPSVPSERATIQPDSPMRFYYHGVYVPRRGLEVLVRALSGVRGAYLYMRGFGPFEAELRRIVDAEGLTDRVFFLEPVPLEELAKAATAFDVGLIMARPTSANGRFVIGFKLFENMAAGLAIVSPASRTLQPFMRKYPVGITFKDCTEEAIVQALQFCVNRPETVRTWKQTARTLAEKEFNASVQMSQFRAVVQRIIGP